MLDALRGLYRRTVPESVRHTYAYRRVRQALWNRGLRREFGVDNNKLAREASFWARHAEDHGLSNTHYQRRLLALTGQDDPAIVSDKIVADFGCGPAGSLCWATNAKVRVGIDVLAEVYTRFGIDQHNMTYVCSTEAWIPLPSNYVDVMFTLNAMDHVQDFSKMCSEVIRILKPGGSFFASLNLHEPRSFAEPQTLTAAKVEAALLDHLDVSYRREAPRGEGEDDLYGPISRATPNDRLPAHQHGFMWIRATKPDRG